MGPLATVGVNSLEYVYSSLDYLIEINNSLKLPASYFDVYSSKVLSKLAALHYFTVCDQTCDELTNSEINKKNHRFQIAVDRNNPDSVMNKNKLD